MFRCLLFLLLVTYLHAQRITTVLPNDYVPPTLNDRPIIGILSQEMTEGMRTNFPGNHSSYIAASYIKFVEGGGARAVPILINQTKSYYEEMAKSVNGVIFPGGAASFQAHNGYADAGWILYKLAVKMNKNGDYFPVWGTCLGFEVISFYATGKVNILTYCKADNVPMNLEFKRDFKKSKMFAKAPDNIINILKSQNVTANFHHFCLTEKNFTSAGLNKYWRVMSLNSDVQRLEFISSFEHKKYPIYGVQFHPEKNTYEWKLKRENPHTADAILVAQYFANFFVNEDFFPVCCSVVSDEQRESFHKKMSTMLRRYGVFGSPLCLLITTGPSLWIFQSKNTIDT